MKNAKKLSGEQYHQILSEFYQIIHDEPQSTQQDMMRALIRNVETKVAKAKTGNKGIGGLRIDYVCDHHLISEWEDKKLGSKKMRTLKRSKFAHRLRLAPRVGFEPTTDRLTADCSATELPRIISIFST